jgi:hypothetical protein
MTNKEILNVWQNLVKTSFPNATRIDVGTQLTEVEAQANSDSDKHLRFLLDLIDEALHFLLQLHRFTYEDYLRLKDKPQPSFLFVLSRACILTTAIRRLVVLGLQEAARPVARSLLETLDLAIVTLADDEFAKRFSGKESEYDANKFWQDYIAKGRLEKRIKNILGHAGLNEEEQNEVLKPRNEIRKQLSASVHSSVSSAFTSMFIPSIDRPGLLKLSLLGHVDAYSPGLLSWTVLEIYHFGAIFHKLLLAEKTCIFLRPVPSEELESMFAAFMTLQHMCIQHPEELPPEFIFPVQL